jgi:hypothetical protein
MNTGLKKLLKLKDWLTVPDAARHLSILFGDDVSEADVLRLALDGHLTLSVHFVNHATAQRGKIIPLADAEIVEVPNIFGGGVFKMVKGLRLGDDEVLSLDRQIVSIDGVCDLPMLGAEQLDVEHKYQLMTDGPAVELTNLGGPLVSRPDGAWGRIVEHFSENKYFDNNKLKSPRNHPDNYYPARALPADAVFVVRTSALQDLEAILSEPEPATERPLKRRERDSLLVISAALAELNGIEVNRPSKAAMEIESATIRKGARISARAIENHLRRIPDALERKGDEGTED